MQARDIDICSPVLLFFHNILEFFMKVSAAKPLFYINQWIFVFFLLFFTPSQAIYNLKTHKEGVPTDAFNKYWILVAQGCTSCDRVLDKLKIFCANKLPPKKNIGFFVIGRSEKKMLEKLKDYKDYDIFSGSMNELYTTYNFQNTPSLLMKKKGKITSGEKGILKMLNKDRKFCLSTAATQRSEDAG